MLLENARGFVYCVSQMGVTGKGANFHSQIREYLTEVKKESKIPVMMGFGIRTAADVAPLEDIIDGAIVGSHLSSFLKLIIIQRKLPQIMLQHLRRSLMPDGTDIS